MIRRLLVAGLTTTALAAAACGGGGSSGPSGSSSSSAGASSTVTFTETEFKIDTATSTLKAGSYTFNVVNQGSFPHDLHIATPDGSEIGKTDVLQPKATGTIQVTLKPGTYTIWCAVDAHRAQGMQGTLTVT